MKFYYPKNDKGEVIGFKTSESQVYDKSGQSLTDKMNNIETNKATKAELEVEKKRIDTLTSSTTTDGIEVIDIRTGADGVVYSSAGTAVREQLKNKISFSVVGTVPAIQNTSTVDTQSYESLVNEVSELKATVQEMQIALNSLKSGSDPIVTE